MNNILKYKDFTGDAHFSSRDECFYGKLFGVDDLITYEARSVEQLKQAFKESVDEYIGFCKKRKKKIFRSFKGSFNIRLTPELHKQAYFKAQEEGISLNSFVRKALEDKLS